MADPPALPPDYQELLADLVARVRASRMRALAAVYEEQTRLYWEIGHEILTRQGEEGWGSKVIERLARDLRGALGEKGWSRSSLQYMRAFATAWPDPQIVQRAVGQLPWGHNVILLDKLNDPDTRLWYAAKAVEHGWSRNILVLQIESRLHQRQGRGLSNFARTLPPERSDMAQEMSKNPYMFDFLGLGDEAREHELEGGLLRHVERFLLEMGDGFALVGRQKHLEVGGQDFSIDLLLYQLELRCYVVIELKIGEFKPEYAGKLNFYLAAVDELVKSADDEPTVGLILCKSANRAVVEYTLRNMSGPLQISEYRSQPLPASLARALPPPEEIEAVLDSLPMPEQKGAA